MSEQFSAFNPEWYDPANLHKTDGTIPTHGTEQGFSADFDIDEDLEIPDKCNGCAIQCDLNSMFAELAEYKESLIHDAISLMGSEGEEMDSEIDKHTEPEVATVIKKWQRIATEKNMQDTDQDLHATGRIIRENYLACSGVLEMQASKEGTVYTVSVCTSPLI